MPPLSSRYGFEHNVFLLVDEMECHADDEKFLRNRIWALGDSIEHLRYLHILGRKVKERTNFDVSLSVF